MQRIPSQLDYQPLISSTEQNDNLNKIIPTENGYQQNTVCNRRKSNPNFTSNDELQAFNLHQTTENIGWLSSLQNLTVDFISNGFTGGEHQPLPGIDSEFKDNHIFNTKYSS